MKTNCTIILLLALAGVSPAADPSAAPPGADPVRLTPTLINELAESMRTNHPGLGALQARARAAAHATNAVRTWADPMFRFGGVVATDRGPLLREEGDLVYGLEQSLPLFGKPAAERRVAQSEAEVAVARQEMQFQFYRRDLVKLLFATAYAETTIEVGRRDLAWLETMAAATDERYRAGTASQFEFLRIQNERARRADLLKTDALMRDHLRVSVNRLLHRPLETALPRLQLPDLWPAVAFDSRLGDYAVKFEPNLRLMAREVDTAEARVSVARKARLPEVVAGVEGRQYSGDGNFREGMFTVGISLPWLNRGRYRSELARDRAQLEAALLDRAAEELRVREEIHRVLTEIDTARREAILYRDEILPRSRQAMEVAHANWVAGRGMFIDTMEARRMLLDAELMYARAVSRQYQSLSELVLCCGLGDLESLEALREEKPGAEKP